MQPTEVFFKKTDFFLQAANSAVLSETHFPAFSS